MVAESSVITPEQQAPIEAATEADPVEEDEFATSDFDASSNASTSITSSVYSHSYENGRRVRDALRCQAASLGEPVLAPCDEADGGPL